MKKFRIILIIIAAIFIVYIAGPKPPKPVMNNILPKIEGSVDNYVIAMEHKPGLILRPGCEAKIIWANDSTKQQTEYVLLYLHGFSASHREGYPLNEDFPKKFGCNAFLTRLASHGMVTENPLIDLTPDLLYESAKEALVIAHQLGRKVIIMGCSMGGTLALKLAADFPDQVHAMILYSPLWMIKNKTAKIVSGPWGLQIARLNLGGDFRSTDDDPKSEVCKYWYCKYRAEGIVGLQQLVDVLAKKETVGKIKCPVFMGYYFKDEQHQDQVVEVKATLEMIQEIGTPLAVKRSINFPEAGAHVICSDLVSGSVNEVRKETFAFAEEILGMKAK